jgi:hypothetical protein
MTSLLLSLRTAIYPAPDLARAKAWHAQVLEQAPYFDEPFPIGFEVGGAVHAWAAVRAFGSGGGVSSILLRRSNTRKRRSIP